MIDKLQELEGKTKLKFYKNLGIFYDEMKHKFSNSRRSFR